jgi:hypothetical protein
MTRARNVSDSNLVTFKNILINGGFDIWQRGTGRTYLTGGAYLADRWCGANQFQNSGVSRVSLGYQNPDLNSQFAYRAGSSTVAEASGGTRIRTMQKVESLNSYGFRGKQVTLSFWIRFSSATATASAGSFGNFEASIGYNTSNTDSATATTTHDARSSLTIPNGSLPTTWTKYSVTGTVPTNCNNLSALFSFIGLGNTATNDAVWYELAEVQLEEGSVATSFEQRPIGTELSLCERYFQRYTGGVGCGLTGIANSGTSLIMNFSLNMDMRIPPTPSGSGQIWISDQYVTDQQTASVGVASPQGVNTQGGRLTLNNFSGLTTGRYYSTPATSIGSGFIDFGAEL